jgi:hypothetical protein
VSFVWQGLGNIGFWPSRVAHGGACESLQCVRIVRRERGPQRPQTDLELPLKKRGWASGTGRLLSLTCPDSRGSFTRHSRHSTTSAWPACVDHGSLPPQRRGFSSPYISRII